MNPLQWIQAHGCNSHTTLPRAVLGLFAGAAVGAAFVAFGVGAAPVMSGATPNTGTAVASVIFAFPVAGLAFAVGLTAAAPLWWGLALSQDPRLAALMALVGATVGGVIWKVAYRTRGACAVGAA